MCDWIASDSDAFPLFELESFDYVPIGDSSEEGRLEDPSLIADKGNGLNLGGAPRTCGDDPPSSAANAFRHLCSPHMRG